MATVINLYGRDQVLPVTDSSTTDYFQLEKSYEISVSRAAGDLNSVTLQDKHFVELVFTDNSTWFGDRNTLQEIFPELKNQARSGEAAPILPISLSSDDPSRGLVSNIAMKLFRIFVKKEIQSGIKEIATSIESKALTEEGSGKIKEGLYKVAADFSLTEYHGSKITGSNLPALLFIHGTSSSARGAFGALANSKVWEDITGFYGDRILAFEHRTLTVGPFQNVLELIQALPPNTTYDLVTHSRGGLVGELLVRFAESETGFLEQSIALLQEEGREKDIACIQEACTLMRQKSIKVGRFVRVACTARGTSLLSERTDIFLNTLINLIHVSAPLLAVLTGGLKMLIAETVNSKNSFTELPGLEAQRPGSAVIKALNTFKAFDENENPIGFDNRLAVISGNGKLSVSLNGLKILLTKFFFQWKENDLVVDTASMYQGAKRKYPVQYFLDHNPNTNHFNYFLNDNTRDALRQALFANAAKLPAFKEVQGENFDAAANRGIFGLENGRLMPVKPSGKKPIVILLPGIMGSFLEKENSALWINYFRFATGGLTKLAVSDDDSIKATGVIKTAYNDLVEYLSASYDVIVFPFDWRKPLSDAGKQLATLLENLRSAFTVTISLTGHSMGGLVIRDLIIHHGSTWKWLNEQPAFRVLLLGTPWLGSYRIPHVLSGKDSIIKQLDLIDIAHNRRTLINMFSKFPGLLDLLPVHDSRDFGSIKIWDDFVTAAGMDTETIPERLLRDFSSYTQSIKDSIDSIDYSNIVYVAGKDKETVKDYVIENGKLQFYSTAEGDQSVTWASGIPAKLDRSRSLYYTNATHGGLSKKAFLFPGILEILQTGTTASPAFSRVPLPVSDSERSFASKEKFEFETSEAGIETGILGLDDIIRPEETNTPLLNISVSNGDLMFARYPVMIGHFAYDDIYNAEAIANNYLNNALLQKHTLGLYPGPVGTNEFFPNTDAPNDFPGCLVVGLGLSETLNANLLTLTIEKAVSDYLLMQCKNNLQRLLDTAPGKLGLSTLLIGAGYAGMAIESACRAMLKGVINANQNVMALTGMQHLYISELEFIELFEDKSIACFTSLNSLVKNNIDGMNLGWSGKTVHKNPGYRKRLFPSDTNDWWQRLCVLSEMDKTTETIQLSFYSSTNNAREEKKELNQNMETLEDMIEDISTSKQWVYEKARSLFELLIPVYFKETIRRKSPVLWVLDEYAASYPWELLQTGSQLEKPLCVSAPMIRQLATSNFDPAAPLQSNNVMIIGDPDLQGFERARQLPGAAREAREVYALLSDPKHKGKLRMEDPLINAAHTRILFNLYKQDYKIIHIAAHGFFDEKNGNETGIVIGRSKKNPSRPHYITPDNIGQLPGTPELVFINCCFLGKINPYAEEYSASRGKMAANIGTRLIQKGVKAVVVAGWEVDDTAALAFAKKFYEAMLAGRNFGDAVHAAREYVYNNFSYTNTWGAFQCYGQPQYRLDTGASRKSDPVFDIPQEAENMLENIISKSEIPFYKTEDLTKELGNISNAIKDAGFNQPSVKQLEASAWLELNEYDKAIGLFNELFKSESADFKVTALETFQNIQVEQAVTNCMKQASDKKINSESIAAQLAVIKTSIHNIEKLLDIWETAERYSLLGSCMKRQAWIVLQETSSKKNAAEMKLALQAASGFYYSAFKIAGDSYNFTGWLATVMFSGMLQQEWEQTYRRNGKEVKESISLEKIQLLLKQLQKKNTQTPPATLSDRYAPFEIALCKYLLDPDHKNNHKNLLDSFKKAWTKTGSINKKMRQKQNIGLLADFAAASGNSALAESLQEINKFTER